MALECAILTPSASHCHVSAKALQLEADSVHLHQLMGQQLRRKAAALQALLADPLAVWDPMVTMVASIHAPLR
jgi:hypothetical protein